MKSHVWRPLFVILGIVALILLARLFIVPEDFKVHDTGYMYGWYRSANLEEWKEQKIKYKTVAYCGECHDDKVEGREDSAHGVIECENCHGPAIDHPEDPETLAIDRSRHLCLRCHAYLPYPSSGRMLIPGVDPEDHNPGEQCVTCHDPHNPSLEEMEL